MILLHINRMETYCVSCKMNTANKNSSVKRAEYINASIKCDVCGNKNRGSLKIKKLVGI